MAGAPLKELRDDSSLDGSLINTSARAAWVLRMARQTADGHRCMTQSAMRAKLAEHDCESISASRLSKIEGGTQWDVTLVDGYERALGLLPGQLRAPLEMLAQTFPMNAPIRAARDTQDVRSLSRLSEEVELPGCSGGAWLNWARGMEASNAHGLPLRLAEPWIERLVSDLGRSVGAGYPNRYQALVHLRRGPYADVVLEVAKASVADPGIQVLFALMSAISDAPDQSMIRWIRDLLFDARPHVLVAACLAITNGLCVGGPTLNDWSLLTDPLVAAFNDSADIPDRRVTISRALVALPRPLWVEVSPRLRRRPERPPRFENLGAAVQHNRAWATATRLAEDVTRRLGLPEDKVLARLIFEVIFDYRETRVTTSSGLLCALPCRDVILEVLTEHAAQSSNDADQASLLERLMTMMSGHRFDFSDDLFARLSPTDRGHFLVLRGQAGESLDPRELERLRQSGGYLARRALYAAGMAGDPWLTAVINNPDAPTWERGAAKWWISQGPRVAGG